MRPRWRALPPPPVELAEPASPRTTTPPPQFTIQNTLPAPAAQPVSGPAGPGAPDPAGRSQPAPPRPWHGHRPRPGSRPKRPPPPRPARPPFAKAAGTAAAETDPRPTPRAASPPRTVSPPASAPARPSGSAPPPCATSTSLCPRARDPRGARDRHQFRSARLRRRRGQPRRCAVSTATQVLIPRRIAPDRPVQVGPRARGLAGLRHLDAGDPSRRGLHPDRLARHRRPRPRGRHRRDRPPLLQPLRRFDPAVGDERRALSALVRQPAHRPGGDRLVQRCSQCRLQRPDRRPVPAADGEDPAGLADPHLRRPRPGLPGVQIGRDEVTAAATAWPLFTQFFNKLRP